MLDCSSELWARSLSGLQGTQGGACKLCSAESKGFLGGEEDRKDIHFLPEQISSQRGKDPTRVETSLLGIIEPTIPLQ